MQHTAVMSIAEVARTPGIAAEMAAIGRRARAAARVLSLASTAAKNAALLETAKEIRAQASDILGENSRDVADMTRDGGSPAFLDRLTLTEKRIEAMAKSIEEIAALPDPVGAIIAEWDRPNGLNIERVRTPLGVIGIIYESRPERHRRRRRALPQGRQRRDPARRLRTRSARRPRSTAASSRASPRPACRPTRSSSCRPRDRAAVGLMLTGLDGAIDVIVPRGGKSLVARVQAEARVPVFAHLEGVCHVYVHAAADLAMAEKIVVNAKMRRPGVCGAAETLLVDRAVVGTHLKPLVEALQEAGCAIRGDEATRALVAGVTPATEADWSTEYLDAIIAVKVVDGIDAAIDHIERYGSHHTDAIVTDDQAAAEKFLAEVDSAIVLHNASTQFADGGEFGMGAEIGIATGRLHARGPVGVEQLTSFKYRVRGSGQVRP